MAIKIHSLPVSLRSMLQETIARSTILAKYMAMAKGVKKDVWLWGLLDRLNILKIVWFFV